jgi:uncharacterized membrane protein
MSTADTPEKGFPLGPVQMLVVGFPEFEFTGTIMEELKRLKDADIVRLVDLMVVKKDEDGNVTAVQTSDLTQEESMTFGAIAGALIGMGAGADDDEEITAAAAMGALAGEDGHVFSDAEVWYVADAIPENTAAAVALIEHRWAMPLRDKILEKNGFVLADEWIHPKDLIAVGATAAASKETAKA